MIADQKLDGHQFWHLYSFYCEGLFEHLKLVSVMLVPHISLGLKVTQFGQISFTRKFFLKYCLFVILAWSRRKVLRCVLFAIHHSEVLRVIVDDLALTQHVDVKMF